MTNLNIGYNAARKLFQHAETNVLKGGEDISMWCEVADGLRNACQIIPEWTQHNSCIRLAGDGWMISYKSHPTDSDEPETALIDRRTDTFFMLSGDHRMAYERVASTGWDALYSVYLSLKDRFPHEF